MATLKFPGGMCGLGYPEVRLRDLSRVTLVHT